jgi:hypothetical protein
VIRVFCLILLIFGASKSIAQDDFLDSEFESVDFEAPSEQTVNPPTAPNLPQYTSPQPKKVTVEEELRAQSAIVERKRLAEKEVGAGINVNRFPTEPPLFKKPPGPTQGGAIKVEHPSAAKGLLRINKDGSYQYRTKLKEKSASGSFSVAIFAPPKIQSESGSIDFEEMYGSENLYAGMFAYEWQPFRGFGSLGLQVGAGITSVTAKGYFKNPNPSRPSRAQESYNLFIVPISAFLVYRLEYFRRQWLVPFVSGGGIYYGLAEVRNDGKAPTLAGAPAIGGGGGLLLSVSRWDWGSAYAMSEEYGIADMWVLVQARAMQGLNKATDFTNQTLDVGIAVDF